MIRLEAHIVNSKGQKAFIGDKIKLDLWVQGWMNKEEVYAITEIRVDGTVMLNTCIGQHISGIKDFQVVNKQRR